ncbi:MAG: hypothetical protein IKM34_06290 [Clostridia bacterium]|nr:hypothetical protein [Clostridia bacterium]
MTMKLSAIIAGLFFLFNPNVNLIDILPDAVGVGLILYGITPFSHIQSRMADAARALRMLTIIELIKLGSLYFYSFFTGTEQLMLLLIAMVFAAFEIFFSWQAFSNLFIGLEDFGSAEEQPKMFEKIKMIRVFTLIFLAAKSVFAFLPDLTLLDDARYGEVTGTGIASWQNYRGVFTVFAFVLILVVGIVWLAMTVSFFRVVKREKAMLDVINTRAAAYYSETESFIYRHSILSLSFLLYAFLLCLELKIEGYSILPPMISAVLFLIFFVLMRRFFKKEALVGVISSALYFVTSGISYVLLYLFADKYYLEDAGFGFSETIIVDIEGVFEIFDEYLGINLIVALSQIVFFVMMLTILRIMKKLIDEQAGVPESMVDDKDKTDALRHHEEKADRDAKNALRKPLVALFVVSILTSLSCAVFPLLQVYFPTFFTIDLVIRVVFVAVAASAVAKLRQGIKVKGGLDFE